MPLYLPSSACLPCVRSRANHEHEDGPQCDLRDRQVLCADVWAKRAFHGRNQLVHGASWADSDGYPLHGTNPDLSDLRRPPDAVPCPGASADRGRPTATAERVQRHGVNRPLHQILQRHASELAKDRSFAKALPRARGLWPSRGARPLQSREGLDIELVHIRATNFWERRPGIRQAWGSDLLVVTVDVEDEVNRACPVVLDGDGAGPVAGQPKVRVICPSLPRAEVDRAGERGCRAPGEKAKVSRGLRRRDRDVERNRRRGARDLTGSHDREDPEEFGARAGPPSGLSRFLVSRMRQGGTVKKSSPGGDTAVRTTEFAV